MRVCAGGWACGVKVLVTAGPTREAIDPVRYITNRSSGRMGHAIAVAAVQAGHAVRLISGPTVLSVPRGLDLFLPVSSARQMHAAVLGNFRWADALFMVAAVADWRPRVVARKKYKKADGPPVIQWVRNPDILAAVARIRRRGQRVCGFAAETGDPVPEARRKLREKGLDLVVANDVTGEGAGFGCETNVVTLIYADGRMERLPLMRKSACARHILRALLGLA